MLSNACKLDLQCYCQFWHHVLYKCTEVLYLCTEAGLCCLQLQFPLAGMSASGWLAVLLTCWFLHSAKAAPTLRVNVTVLERSGQWVQVPELHGLLRLCSSSRWPKDT
jgi:hypothetical protein